MRRPLSSLFLERIEWQLQVLIFLKVLLLQMILQPLEVVSTHVELDPLVGKNTPETIQALGYPVDGHVIKTSDNILLQYFRIPHGRNEITGTYGPKPVILLVHGLMTSSYEWFIQDDDKILPLILAEEGYDVWLANSRGVSYSNQLQDITSKNTSFWQFSWHEMGVFDLPASIDYILNATNQRQLFYIGHSQGTTQLFVLLSELPEYNSKIRLMVALAPIAYLTFIRGLDQLISYVVIPINYFGLPELLTSLGFGPLFSNTLLNIYHHFGPIICGVQPFKTLCHLPFFVSSGFDFEQVNDKKWPHFLSRLPDSTSVRTGAHYTQVAVSKKFQQYDHGLIKNLKRYGTYSPPLYNVSRITAPVALFWAENDLNSHPKDVQRLARELGNVTLNYRVPFDLFNHSDFVYAKDAYSLVYIEVLRILAAYL